MGSSNTISSRGVDLGGDVGSGVIVLMRGVDVAVGGLGEFVGTAVVQPIITQTINNTNTICSMRTDICFLFRLI